MLLRVNIKLQPVCLKCNSSTQTTVGTPQQPVCLVQLLHPDNVGTLRQQLLYKASLTSH